MCASHRPRSRPDRRLDSCPPGKTMMFYLWKQMVMTRFEGNVLKQQQKWFLPGIQSSERANSSQGMGLPTPGKKTIFFMFFGDISFDYLEPVRTWSKVSWSGDQSIAEIISLMLACFLLCELTFVEISAPLNLFQKQNTFRHSGDPER